MNNNSNDSKKEAQKPQEIDLHRDRTGEYTRNGELIVDDYTYGMVTEDENGVRRRYVCTREEFDF